MNIERKYLTSFRSTTTGAHFHIYINFKMAIKSINSLRFKSATWICFLVLLRRLI